MTAPARRPKDFRQSEVTMSLDFPAPGIDFSAGGVAATQTVTCDTLANSTALDFFIIDDGRKKAMISYDTTGSIAAKYAKYAVKATAIITCDSTTNTANEGYITVWDGHRTWKIMFDTDGSGDSTGTADLIVDTSGVADTAAGTGGALHAIIMESTSIPAFTEAIHLTSVDNADGTVTLTCDFAGYDGNGGNAIGGSLANAWVAADATGGLDAYDADEFGHTDISGATTAIDVATLVNDEIDALAWVRVDPTDNLDGTVLVTNQDTGAFGNVDAVFSETGSTLMNLTDMAGGLNVDATGATAAVKLFTVDHKRFRVDRVELIVPDGITEHAANYWTVGVKAGATVMAQWSTATAAEGTIAADTFVDCTLSATAANQVADQDDVISMFFTKAASAVTLPLGRIVIHGRHL